MALTPLPIDELLPALTRAIQHRPVVLEAATGAGKTTRVPPALADCVKGRILVLEPRRIAARAAARRVASERGWTLGGEVGWHVRLDRRAGADTRVLFATEGIALRIIQDDPFLEGIGAVVLDELHERSLTADLCLALLRQIRAEARPDLVLVAMSATLDTGPVARWLDAAVLTSAGRTFPVEVRTLPLPDDRPVWESAADAVCTALDEGQGDVLVFLPGLREIRRTEERLHARAATRGVDVRLLYGDLPMDAQDAALRRGPRRRVVLATNVAETSVTVEGVGVVVDTGLARSLRYDPAAGLSHLQTVRISKAAADQRAGRAGRERPGLCLRLWTDRMHRALDDFDIPEVLRCELAGPLMALVQWGMGDPRDFPWFEPPPAAAVEAGLELLTDLGALAGGRLTPVGENMARLAVAPRLGRMLVAAHALGHPEVAATAAALLSERRRRLPGMRPTSSSDLLDDVEELEAGALAGDRWLRRVQDQILRQVRSALGTPPRARIGRDLALQRAVLAGWPDRLARRRAPGSDRAVLVGGRGIRLSDESAVREAELFTCVDLDGAGPEAWVRLASAVDPSWLDVTDDITLGFDPERQRVTALRRTRYRDLILAEHPVEAAAEQASAVLFANARTELGAVLPDDPDLHSLLARLRCLAGWMPELGLPDVDRLLETTLRALCDKRRSYEALRRAPWQRTLLDALPWSQRQALDTHAPERLEVPTGSRIRLQYEPGRPPVLAVRIQELFGSTHTPRIASGRVAVLLHLLAPNQRPQQITDDLAGFWERTYPEVRKELRRRYPKHAWPDDPASASPEHRPKRRR